MRQGRQFKPGTERWRVLQPQFTDHQMTLPGLRDGLQFLEGHPLQHEVAETTFGMTAPTGRTRPIEHVYRGMSHAEWEGAQKNGYIKSDERGNIIPGWEGTNAGVEEGTAHHYLNDNWHKGNGVVAKIAVHPDDGWFTSDADSYIRTRKRVPLERVVSHTVLKDGKPQPAKSVQFKEVS